MFCLHGMVDTVLYAIQWSLANSTQDFTGCCKTQVSLLVNRSMNQIKKRRNCVCLINVGEFNRNTM